VASSQKLVPVDVDQRAVLTFKPLIVQLTVKFDRSKCFVPLYSQVIRTPESHNAQGEMKMFSRSVSFEFCNLSSVSKSRYVKGWLSRVQ
jgi:hypothetical protein